MFVTAIFWLAWQSAKSIRSKAAVEYRGFQNHIKERFSVISQIKAFFKWLARNSVHDLDDAGKIASSVTIHPIGGRTYSSRRTPGAINTISPPA